MDVDGGVHLINRYSLKPTKIKKIWEKNTHSKIDWREMPFCNAMSWSTDVAASTPATKLKDV